MMKATQIKWSKYQKLLIERKLFTVLLWFFCCNNIFGQIYIGEGTTIIVENRTFICQKAEARTAENFSEVLTANDTLHLAAQIEVPAPKSTSSNIKTEKKHSPEPEVKKNKIAEVPSCNFSTGPDQHFTSFKKGSCLISVPVHNPTLLVYFQTGVQQDKDFTFSCKLSPEKLSEQYKNRILYSFSVIRPPPSSHISGMQKS
ncbi:hypothetical protein ACTJIV_04850 [Chryseobacterium sp. 22532]|uniref:hypothetical protein n=1 Tax=Chryseobacterium sp. 22532 TaxID=3453938 RepID=UPI003F84D912